MLKLFRCLDFGKYYMKKKLDITLSIGCRVQCHYCPQSSFVKLFHKHNSKTLITLEDFLVLCKNIPTEYELFFSGFSEPFLNKECSSILKFANSKGYKISVFTTLEGAKPEDIDLIKDIPFLAFKVRLADNKNQMKINVNEHYLNLIEQIISSKIDNIEFSMMSFKYPNARLPKDVESIFSKNRTQVQIIDSFTSRAGTLEPERVSPVKYVLSVL